MKHSPQSLLHREVWAPDDFGWVLREEAEKTPLTSNESLQIALIGANHIAFIVFAEVASKHNFVQEKLTSLCIWLTEHVFRWHCEDFL